MEKGGSIDSVKGAYETFLHDNPEFLATRPLDALRASEFSRLDRQGQVYLDYTGGGLYADSQVKRHMALLLDGVFGNPHSSSPTSQMSTELVERCRAHVLRFFNASPDEYAVVFTANASHALKLVGESYPFGQDDQFLLTFDNHNSVNGIREFARAHRARTTYVPVIPPDMRVDAAAIDRYLALARPGGHNLFAYPAQSNFSGVQHPLEWIRLARAQGWDVLLDAAAFVPTNPLDLTQWQPDFVVLSFYKMFGYPTGVGALIGRHRALERLHRPWFAGGTITVASVQADRYYLASGPAAFEEGTINYETIPAVEIGLEMLESIGVEVIHRRVRALARWLIAALVGLRHSTGRPLVALYGPRTMELRGGTITMNFLDHTGSVIDHRIVEERASRRMISLRTGCFCNPGAGELALGLSKEELVSCFLGSEDRMTYDDFRRCVDGKSSGALRVSLGMASNFADVHTFAQLAQEFLE
jgi:molybdenum cofactor sulfurtransferase